ncbi:MAG: Holliday junction branch migration protein RuvA [Candidatus Hydrogenedentota bacterium]
MIESIKGRLIRKEPLTVYLEVGSFVLKINVPLSSHDKLGRIGDNVTLLCHLYIREDDLQIYGFATEEERTLFRLLITVKQISCRIASQILSNIDIETLSKSIATKDVALLRTIPGVGERLAGRIVVELADKIKKIKPAIGKAEAGLGIDESLYEDTRDALITLGYNKKESENAISRVLRSGYKPLDTADLIKRCLKEMI